MAMMSVQEMWLETSSVGRSCSGSPMTVTLQAEEDAAEPVEQRGISLLEPEAEPRDDELDGDADDQHRQVDENEEQRSEDHLLRVLPSGTA